MADKSAIEWTDATWNPVAGCSIVSPGCTHCYAMKMAARIERMNPAAAHYAGLTQPSKAGAVWTGKVALAPDQILRAPLGWKKPRRIFVNSMSDLFHEDVPDAWIDRVFAVMALAPQHTFQVLTKRAQRMRDYLSPARAHPVGLAALELTFQCMRDNPRSEIGAGVMLQGDIVHLKTWPLPNAWLGVSAERQQEADERIPLLLDTPAAKRFISAEPLLGSVDFNNDWIWHRLPGPKIDWVIAGGESGSNARPTHPLWLTSMRDRLREVGVPFFFKQWGEFADLTDSTPGERDRSTEDKIFTARGEVLGVGVRDGRNALGAIDADWRAKGGAWMGRVGKKAAGAKLDGREHREMPA